MSSNFTFGYRNYNKYSISSLRITRFRYNFVLKWGSFGSGNSQFMRPHDIAFDSKGNVYVSGRDNNNIQKFTHNGTFLMNGD